MNLTKRLLQFLQSPPKSIVLRYGLLITLFMAVMVIFSGFYAIANGLAGGDVGIPAFVNFASRDEEIEPSESNTLLPEFSVMPEGVMTPWDGTSRVTVLVMGLDYRDWSSGAGPSRTDTMMLLTLDPLNNTAGMLSIPRDLWVPIPGFYSARINTAYFLGESHQLPGGGPGLAVKTVEAVLGVEVNYFAQIDFGAFVRFIDEIGGVKIDVPERIKIDPIVGPPVYLKPERQTLFGDWALAYARARNTEGGDLDRAIRQQQVILGIRNRLLSPDKFSILISKAPTLYAELAAGIQTNMTLDEVIQLALLAQKVPDEDIKRGSISTSQVMFANTLDKQSVLIPLPEKIRQLRDEIFLRNPGTLGPLSPGSQQERMSAEGARIVLLNGSHVNGLAERTQGFLQSQSANVVEISNADPRNITRIVDYTGNPHTVRYLMELFGTPAEYYQLDFNPNSPVDVVVTLGSDWGNNNELP